MKNNHYQKGFTLIETLIGTALFVMISTAVYFSYSNILDIVIAAQLNSAGLTVLDNEVEVIRNMPYQSIGTVGGVPAGILSAEKNVTFNGIPFTLKTTVRNIDDAFDGTIGGSPNDTAPADYKIIELELSCGECQRFLPAKVTTTVAPPGLEISSNNGALFINVINSSGQPVSQATVQIANTAVSPNINITDITNINGQLQLVDIATSSLSYRVTVSKNGYSVERTYSSVELGGATPVKPHSTVAEQQVTSITFSIDQLSSVILKANNYYCQPVADFDFNLSGAKLLGNGPNVLKYNQSHITDSAGLKSLSSLEWDTYAVQNTDAVYDISGLSLMNPFNLNPATAANLTWNTELKSPSSLLVSVRDQSGQLQSDASVALTSAGFSANQSSGHRQHAQSDWSGSQFSNISANIETEDPAGQIHISSVAGKYASASDEWLESTTVDFGTNDTTFYKLNFNPLTQLDQASLKIQIATNNDNASWNYLGPDGTPSSFYTVTDTSINPVHNGSRYLRYKVILRTEDESATPSLDDIGIEFKSSCIVAGQSYFSGLANGNYTLSIQKAGFQNFSSPITINSAWQNFNAVLIP